MDAEEIKLERQRLRIDTRLRRAKQKLQREQFVASQTSQRGWKVIFTPTGAAVAAAIIGICGTAASKWFDLLTEQKKQETSVILRASEVPQNIDEASRSIQRARNLLWFAEAGYVTLPARFVAQLRSDSQLKSGQIPSAPAVQSTSDPLAANKQGAFDSGRLPRLVTLGDFQSALAQADYAIAHYRDLVAACSQDDESLLLLYNSQVGYYMCVKAQLLALRGDFVGADIILSLAKAYASSHPGFSGILMSGGWEIIVSTTNAFILEKEGKRNEATTAYKSANTIYGEGRLALLALDAGDDIKARQLALAAGINPTAYYVLGSLEEKTGDKQAAREWYSKASVELQTVKNQFLPIYFCEGPAVASAQKRLEK